MNKLDNIDTVLDKYVPAEELAEVKRILYGYNQGKPVAVVPVTEEGSKNAKEFNFDLKAFKFTAAAEEMRAPRIVKIGLIQHSITHSTTDTIAAQVPAALPGPQYKI